MRWIGVACRASLAAALFVFAQFEVGAAYANPPDDVAESEIRNARPGGIIRIWPLEGGSDLGAKARIGCCTVPRGSTASRSRLRQRSFFRTGRRQLVDGPSSRGRIQPRESRRAARRRSCREFRFKASMRCCGAGMWSRPRIIRGSGTPGVHPYLIGDSEAYSVLDSVRAARELPDAKAQKRFAVWGHSQGGHAALFGPARGQLCTGSRTRRRCCRGARDLPRRSFRSRPAY